VRAELVHTILGRRPLRLELVAGGAEARRQHRVQGAARPLAAPRRLARLELEERRLLVLDAVEQLFLLLEERRLELFLDFVVHGFERMVLRAMSCGEGFVGRTGFLK